MTAPRSLIGEYPAVTDRALQSNPPPQFQPCNQTVRHALVLDSHQHPIVTSADADAANDALRLRVAQNALLPMTSSNAAPLDSSHWHIEGVVNKKRGVDYSRSGLKPPRHSARLRPAAGPYRCVESELRIVRSRNRLLCIPHRIKRYNGPKRLFL